MTAGLEVRMGSKEGVSFRLKAVRQLVDSTKEGSVRTGVLSEGWQQIAVMAGKGDEARMFVLEPAPGEDETLGFKGFYVRGPFKITEKINNQRKAYERWKAFEPS